MALVSSTLVLEAASISIRSMKLPSSIDLQASQQPQGVLLTPFSQLRDFANSLARVVLPTPLVPVSR